MFKCLDDFFLSFDEFFFFVVTCIFGCFFGTIMLSMYISTTYSIVGFFWCSYVVLHWFYFDVCVEESFFKRKIMQYEIFIRRYKNRQFLYFIGRPTEWWLQPMFYQSYSPWRPSFWRQNHQNITNGVRHEFWKLI